ncbi:hypothetical protein X560_0239 [Listeria fleischmannii 1991]|uniref:Uncharacterized protein n=1 Tax=Listeria fleischmannii 1991 TaxID=1430899 RepID=A0A0J8GEQ8_9LIST|nr:hypothetical protein X560_0239 [Listeria fleischmannii 1991]
MFEKGSTKFVGAFFSFCHLIVLQEASFFFIMLTGRFKSATKIGRGIC